MKTLGTLIKLASAEVDEKRLVLRAEQEREDAIKAALADLEASLATERQTAGELGEAAYAYAAFGAAAMRRREALQEDLLRAGAAVETARDALSACYERQKRYEITDAGRRRRDAAEIRRRETIDADERSLQRHGWRRRG